MREQNIYDFLDGVMLFTFQIAAIVGSAWLVFFHGISPWWFLLTAVLLTGKTTYSKEVDLYYKQND